MPDFSNKTVLITGGSRGIGSATARAFAASGARVVVNFQREYNAATQTIESLDGEAHFAVRADISDARQVEKLIETVYDECGQLDILVNNAAVYHEHPLASTSYEDWQAAWQDLLAVNLIGVANLCFCAAKLMGQQGGGRIVNVGSRGAYRGEPNSPAYGASKAGLHSLTQSLALSLAPDHIFVHAVAPGFVATEMSESLLEGPAGDDIRAQSPHGRVATPEEVAHAICYLACEEACWTTGSILDINGASYMR